MITVLRWAVVLFVTLLLQTTLVARLPLFQERGDIMLLMVIAAAIVGGPELGAVIGFVFGLSFDLVLQTPFGLSALAYCITGYAVGALQSSVLRSTWWIPVLSAIAGSAIGVVSFALLGDLLGQDGLLSGASACDHRGGGDRQRRAHTAGGPHRPLGHRPPPAKPGSSPDDAPRMLGTCRAIGAITTRRTELDDDARTRHGSGSACSAIVSVSLFCALFARLWYLQVMAAPDYAVAAAANQQRAVVEPAPRGRILDRNGVVLVDNRISTVLTINSQIFDELDDDDQTRVVTRVREELTRYGRPITPEEILAEVTSGRYGLTPVPIAEDVPEELAVYVSERRDEFTDAVNVEPKAVRRYPYGRLAAHVLGYVGPLNETEYEASDEQPAAVPARRRDREVRRRGHLRGDAAGDARAAGARGRRRGQRRSASSRSRRRSRGATSCSPSTPTCRRWPRRRWRSSSAWSGAGRPAGAPAQRITRRFGHGGRSPRRPGARDGLVPRLRPVRVHRRHLERRMGGAQRPGQPLPARSTGPSRASTPRGRRSS